MQNGNAKDCRQIGGQFGDEQKVAKTSAHFGDHRTKYRCGGHNLEP